jgi:chitinase
VNDAVRGTTTSMSYSVGSLACGTTYTVQVVAYDAAGNKSAPAKVAAPTAACPAPPPDTTAPSIPGSLTQSAATTTSLSVQWAASTDNVGVTGYEVSVDGAAPGSTTATSYTLGSLACGTAHTVQVVARDAAGNRSAPANVTASTASCPTAPTDTTAPNVAILSPTDGATVSRLFSVTAAASDAGGIKDLTILVDDVVMCTTSATSVTCSATARTGGWHIVTARAVDMAGNPAVSKLRVRTKSR